MIFSDDEIGSLKKVGVEAVVLFGSRALGIAREGGDWDVGVIGRRSKEAYDVVYDLMTAKINQLVDIDIVFLWETSLELQRRVANYGKVIYQESPNVFADFRQQVMLYYSDFAPLRAVFAKAAVGRISV